MITNHLVWREIERLASVPSNPEPVFREKRLASLSPKPQTGSARRKARRIGVFVPTETAKNERIRLGLERIYGPDRAKTVLEQAMTIYQVSNPQSPNTPELYELFESGLIDEALEMFGATWSIGRPKIE